MPDPSVTQTESLRNIAVQTSRNVPDLISKLRVVDPGLAQQMEGKSLLASKTAPGIVIAYFVGVGAMHFGLAWDPQTIAIVSGGILLVAGYFMRWLTTGPISRLFPHPSAPPAALAPTAPIVPQSVAHDVATGTVPASAVTP